MTTTHLPAALAQSPAQQSTSGPIVAIAYDFDGTLSPANMQERNFIPAIGMKPKRFWHEVDQVARTQNADTILAYMGLMLEKAHAAKVPVRREDFIRYGQGIQFFPGVEGWFDRINGYGAQLGIQVEHYIISSGIREMIAGTSIAHHFKAIFASAFWYDHHDIAQWPALAVNYTTKTQYLFRINKGVLDVYDHAGVNAFIDKSARRVPFEQMVFIGDGETDIPCFRLLKDQGGFPVSVYAPRKHGAKRKCRQILAEQRVHAIAPAIYTENSPLEQLVRLRMERVALPKGSIPISKQ